MATDVTEVSQVPAQDATAGGRDLLRSAGWMTGSHLLAQAFAYGSLILLARWLTPTSFGTIAVGTALVYVAVLFVDHGTLGGLIVRRHLTRTDLLRAFRRCLVTACLLAAGMAAIASLVVTNFASGGDAAAIAALALCLPLHAFAVVPTALLQKTMQFRRLAALNAVANVTSALVAVALAFDGFGTWALVARQLMLFGILALLTPALCRRVLLSHLKASKTTVISDDPRDSERWFFVFGVALMVTANLDYLVIGGLGDAHVVGLYALAFTIAMAPSTHISEQVGRVLFAAAALHPRDAGYRTEQSVRLMSLVFVPLLPVGILAAPALLPAILGNQWQPMVVAFQLLLVVGVGHAIVNCIGEALSGNGHIRFRAEVMVVRCLVTLLALLVLVPVDGIRGAALAQLVVFAPYAAVYLIAGARRAGTSARALARELRHVALILGAQLTVCAVVAAVLAGAGASHAVLLCGASVTALIVWLPMVYWLVVGRSGR